MLNQSQVIVRPLKRMQLLRKQAMRARLAFMAMLASISHTRSRRVASELGTEWLFIILSLVGGWNRHLDWVGTFI